MTGGNDGTAEVIPSNRDLVIYIAHIGITCRNRSLIDLGDAIGHGRDMVANSFLYCLSCFARDGARNYSLILSTRKK